jgi:hypothetical protein
MASSSDETSSAAPNAEPFWLTRDGVVILLSGFWGLCEKYGWYCIFAALFVAFLRPYVRSAWYARAARLRLEEARAPARVQLLEEDRRRVREEQQREYIAAREAREKAEAERKKVAQEAAEAEAERLRSEGNPQGFSEPQGGDRDVRPRGSFMGPSAPRDAGAGGAHRFGGSRRAPGGR